MKKEIKVTFEAKKKTEVNPLFASSSFIVLIEKIKEKFNDVKIMVTNNNYKEDTDRTAYEVIINILYQNNYHEVMSSINEIAEKIQKEYLNIKINIEDIPQLRIRKAKQEELKSLKTIALKIVKNMNANGLQLWNEYYPAEEFKGLIEQEKLYVYKWKY